ncbi:tetratricopeptide repeat protein [Nostoc sp. FACHB-133]|uniref:tetratricopeptide repeat protein n=1 Tax=Nostoc sp. FACHB-133 TaxID=2692835 RepID=UPI0016858CF3|nr:tetratricopeptide repeat protein [Nostoc sp. FACHB-133]MBD2525568.1 tetratricopeptide repeat protein [Nostoc sp. FACHB-133]
MKIINLLEAQVFCNQGLEYLKAGNIEAVIQCFEQALLFNPNYETRYMAIKS